MKFYRLGTIEGLIKKYIDSGGEVSILEEGSLGHGTSLLHNAPGKKVIVIKEVYLNPWSSGHTVRMYNRMPKKYKKALERASKKKCDDISSLLMEYIENGNAIRNQDGTYSTQTSQWKDRLTHDEFVAYFKKEYL